jgi:diguanylate cyclase (GGDEF)-like protein
MIYLYTRILTLVSLVWFAMFGGLADNIDTLFYLIIGTFLAHLLVFIAAVRGKFDLKLAYLSAIIYDLISIPLFISYTGGMESSFYLLFYLTVSVAAYVLTFWFATTVTLIVSAVYILTVFTELSVSTGLDFSMRIGLFWVYFLALSYASDFLRRSEQRLLKLFDTLNMRTSELEKSQAQLEMIYENTRNLAAILDSEGVVREVMRIMGGTLQFTHYAVIFKDKLGRFYYRARCLDNQPNYHLVAIEDSRTELIRKVSSMDEPIYLKDAKGRRDYLPLDKKVRSVMIVPMTSYGHAHGLLVAESKESKQFRERDVKLLSIVARSAALALENAELHRRTEELTIIDELTDTYNYRYFVRKLDEERKRALRYDLPLSLIMVDIDWFKKINDSYGHEVGNEVLVALSNIIKCCIRDVDIFARYGGEEFVIILPQTPQAEASRIGERIRDQVESTIIETQDTGKLKITVSVGVTSFPENGKSHEEIVSIADQALYRAKGSGKNLVCSI